jgi:ADP-ribose pyrophosphatase
VGDEESRTLGEGRHIRLRVDGGWEYAERLGITGIVVIVAVTPDGKLLLVEQFRQPVGARVIELPAGLAGDTPEARGEPLEEAARRELLEETGYRADRFEPLADGPPSPGMTTEQLTLFRAEGLTRVGPGGGDAHEEIQIHEVELSRVESWLRERQRDGRLVDVKVYAGLYFATTARASVAPSSR